MQAANNVISGSKTLTLVLFAYVWVWACSAPPLQEYEIDKPSPDGSFRVRVDVKRRGAGRSLDEAKFRFLIGEEVVEQWEWKQPDPLEPSFDSLLPIEWIDHQVLNIGKISNRVEYRDEVTVTNNSGEYLKYVDISYGKVDSYWIFGLTPGKQVTVRASPWFTYEGDNYSFGYGGKSQSGKRFSNVIAAGDRVFPGQPKKFSITISPEQLQPSKQ